MFFVKMDFKKKQHSSFIFFLQRIISFIKPTNINESEEYSEYSEYTQESQPEDQKESEYSSESIDKDDDKTPDEKEQEGSSYESEDQYTEEEYYTENEAEEKEEQVEDEAIDYSDEYESETIETNSVVTEQEESASYEDRKVDLEKKQEKEKEIEEKKEQKEIEEQEKEAAIKPVPVEDINEKTKKIELEEDIQPKSIIVAKESETKKPEEITKKTVENKPREVKKSNSAKKWFGWFKKEKPTPIFGVEVSNFLKNGELPENLVLLFEYIEEKKKSEGIFRKAGLGSKIVLLSEKLDKNEKITYSEWNIDVVAGVLKKLIRETPEPLIPTRTYKHLKELSVLKEEKEIVSFINTKFMTEVGEAEYILLKKIIEMCLVIEKEKEANLMTVDNIVIVLAPNLVRDVKSSEGAGMTLMLIGLGRKLVESLIIYYDKIFVR